MITDDVRTELEGMATEHAAPPPAELLSDARARARRTRARQRGLAVGALVAAAVVVALALPDTSPRSTPTPVATAGPTSSSRPTGQTTGTTEAPDTGEAAGLPRLRLVDCDGKVPGFCWLAPQQIVVGGATFWQVSSGSLPLRRGADQVLSMSSGSGTPRPSDYRVLVGLVGPRSATLPDAVAYVDGRRVMTLQDGGPRLLDVRRGRHEIRLEGTGPVTPRTHLVIVEYHHLQD